MASNSGCLRCPALGSGQVDIYKHGDDLAKCQKEIKADGKPYELEHLWPLFKGNETVKHFGNKDEAREFIDPFIQGVRNGIDQPWSKGTMEAAAQLAYPASGANKKKQKDKLAGEMSSLSISAPGPSSSASLSVTLTSVPPPPTTNTTAVATFVASTTTPASTTTAPISAALTTPSAPVPAPPTAPTPPIALAALADPSGSHFLTQQAQNTNQATVNQYIQDFAGRLADAEDNDRQRRAQVPEAHRTQLSNQQRENAKPSIILKFGLRTGFTTPTSGTQLETNYLSMTFPQRLYVYNVEMVRQFIPCSRLVLVQKQWDKIKALHRFMLPILPLHPISPAELAVRTALQTNSDRWVTDGSLIWATVGLFNHAIPHQVPGPVNSGPGQAFQYENETGNDLTVARVNITYRQTIDLTRTVGELFFDRTASTFRGSGPDMLARGLNAFFTKSIRDRSDPPAIALPLNFTRVGLNKSFPSTGGFILDGSSPAPHNQAYPPTLRGNRGFSLSVRPGVQSMYINISTATSPFLEHGITVQQFIERCLALPQSRSQDEVFKFLKGVKVRISYNTNNNPQTFPRHNSRCRFVNGIVNAANQAPVSRVRYPHPSIVDAGDWYNVNSFYNNTTEFPSPPLNLANHVYFVNVGQDPTAAPNGVEWYPATVLRIQPWQPFSGLMTRPQTSEMITQALTPPVQHRRRLLDVNPPGGLSHFAFAGPTAGHNQGGLALATLSAGTNFLRIPGRWLNAPGMRYSGTRHPMNTAQDHQNANRLVPATIPLGQPATWNLRNVGFAAAGNVTTLAVLDLTNGNLPHTALVTLRNQLRSHGVIANPTAPWVRRNVTIAGQKLSVQWENNFRQELVNMNLSRGSIVLVVLPDKCYNDYACIKRVGDLMEGIHTICIKYNTAQRMQGAGGLQSASNIALKYNIKAGGDNHHFTGTTLSALKAGNRVSTIVIGADVTHPSKSSVRGTPSIAALVGSVDDQFMRFPGSMRLQQSKREDIEDVAGMVQERLLAWAANHQNQLPQNVLFYRDGVGEDQYDIIRRRELPQIQTAMNLAYRRLNPGTAPNNPPGNPPPLAAIPRGNMSDEQMAHRLKEQEEDAAAVVESAPNNRPLNLTFVVVAKRHNTRFYPQAEGTPAVHGNVRPGLVVDQVITHPYRMDFYLQSHLPIQGMGRSAHYVVLRNNMTLTADQIQTITHTFCYAYASATRAVSYCAPAYYADRLCDRGRVYLRRWLVNSPSAPGLPLFQAGGAQTWSQYLTQVKTYVHGLATYRPHQQGPNSPRQNPWHPSLDDKMFYL